MKLTVIFGRNAYSFRTDVIVTLECRRTWLCLDVPTLCFECYWGEIWQWRIGSSPLYPTSRQAIGLWRLLIAVVGDGGDGAMEMRRWQMVVADGGGRW